MFFLYSMIGCPSSAKGVSAKAKFPAKIVYFKSLLLCGVTLKIKTMLH